MKYSVAMMAVFLLGVFSVVNDDSAAAATDWSNSLLLHTTLDGSNENDADLQRITALSSMQFYTYFALVQKMLTHQWDEETFRKFSLYDRMNLKMMQDYENQLKEHKVWGPFFKMKNALHQKINRELQPLINKKRKSEKLTAADKEKLIELDKLIFEKMIK